MLCGLIMAVFQPMFTSIKTKIISEKGKLLAGFFIMAIALFIFPFMKPYILVYSLIILFAIGGAMIAPQLTAMVSLQDDSNTAKNLSYQTSVNSVGQILGPLIGTWLVGKQVLAPFILSSGLLIISVLAIIWTKRQKKQLVFFTKN